ncbi:MAG: DEAD/DEAH box helicase [Bacteriovoracaceae bacterium]|nr:DEAD/DEAH box helicase [Bacteriovoracaceae bacterium]
MTFLELNLHADILKAINDCKFTEPTDIQAKAIPHLITSDTDFIGQAQTGTGKTAAFVIPLLQRLMGSTKEQNALILTPSRELAKQIEDEIQRFNKYINIKSTVIYGGASYTQQLGAIKKGRPQIIVGTPGRIMDLMDRGVLNFSSSDFLILDEADEMLRMGFFEDVKHIIKTFGENRRLWMFSATMPKQIMDLVQRNFREPVVMKAQNKSLSNEDIEQTYFVVDSRKKSEALYRLITTHQPESAIIFCKTKTDTSELTQKLIARGIKAECLNGDMSQSNREYTMSRFKAGKTKYLVCTDVASRGIDVSGLTHVFNFGLPQDSDSYVHRIGRTGRAGAKGFAYSIITPHEVGTMKYIERLINKKIIRGEIPSTAGLKIRMVESETQKIATMLSTITEKGKEFQIDPSYEVYAKSFADISKDDLQKAIFTLTFNREFRQLNEMGDISVSESSRSGGDRRDSRGGGFRSSRGGDRGGDRRDSRGGSRGGYSSRSGGNGGGRRFESSERSERSENRGSFRNPRNSAR